MHPSIVDGCSLVVLRQNTTAYSVAEKGVLEHDGEALYLVDGDDSRLITDDELSLIKIVRPDSRIAGCRGFDLFLIVD
ncbi:MAG: hypothetical protein JNL58_28510 [Planctomyces sp.]|nr:hypothetical protein [Planctomyces sp.]